MKVIKCGNCQTAYRLDVSLLKSNNPILTCKKCNAKNSVKLKLVLLVQSKGKKQVFQLLPGKYIIGRNIPQVPGNISIDDVFVSRKHLELNISEKNNQLFITFIDTKSTNGTYDKDKKRFLTEKKYSYLVNNYVIIGLTKLSLVLN
jgi:hypothetical protein